MKKIIFGCIFASLLLLSIPFVSNIQAQSFVDRDISKEAAVTPTSYLETNAITLEYTITLLQNLINNYLPEYNEEFVQELQNKADVLNAEPAGSPFCEALDSLILTLIEYWWDLYTSNGPLFILANLAVVIWILVDISVALCGVEGNYDYFLTTEEFIDTIQSNPLTSDIQMSSLIEESIGAEDILTSLDCATINMDEITKASQNFVDTYLYQYSEDFAQEIQNYAYTLSGSTPLLCVVLESIMIGIIALIENMLENWTDGWLELFIVANLYVLFYNVYLIAVALCGDNANNESTETTTSPDNVQSSQCQLCSMAQQAKTTNS